MTQNLQRSKRCWHNIHLCFRDVHTNQAVEEGPPLPHLMTVVLADETDVSTGTREGRSIPGPNITSSLCLLSCTRTSNILVLSKTTYVIIIPCCRYSLPPCHILQMLRPISPNLINDLRRNHENPTSSIIECQSAESVLHTEWTSSITGRTAIRLQQDINPHFCSNNQRLPRPIHT